MKMASTGVRYLVSNSLTHPENTAGNFKVSYDKAINLTGKKIALVNATFTKAQSNVLQEKITLRFKSHMVTKQGPKGKLELSKTALSESPTSWLEYFQKFNKELLDRVTKKKLVHIGGALIEKTKAQIQVFNRTDFTCEVYFTTHLPKTAGWRILNSNSYLEEYSPIYESTYEQQTGMKIMLSVKPKSNLTLYFYVGEFPGINTQQFLPNDVAIRNTHLELNQFTVKAYRSKRVRQSPMEVNIHPGPAHFETIEALLSKINEDPNFKNLGLFEYSPERVKLSLSSSAVKILKDINFGGLEHHFGFDERVINIELNPLTKVFIAARPPDMTRGTHNFFIYCSLVKDVPVNEQNVPLLATLDAKKGAYGKQIQHHMNTPIFVDCVDGPQQLIEVTIGDDSGNVKNLLQGRTTLTLAIMD